MYNKVIEELNNINCLVLSKKRLGKYHNDSNAFFIRGTRYFFIAKKIVIYNRNTEHIHEEFNLEWFFKTKNSKYKFKRIKFDEILDSPLVSHKAKVEILFNLNLFVN